MATINRSLVFWFGHPPTEHERVEFVQRRLTLREVTEGTAQDFNLACGAIFCARPPFISAACDQLEAASSALDHGLLVYLLAEDDATQKHLLDLVPPLARTSYLKDYLRSRTGPISSYECAENIARHDPGPNTEASLEIIAPAHISLTEDQKFLIRRAFNDCAVLSIEPLSGGKSAAAFSVQAKLKASDVGPRPLPFFMKLDESRKISKELFGYQIYAAQHIPWYLRPNLDPRRCLFGLTQGILVGSFVGQSESLWEAVLDGRGPRYIHALFEETLMGWRSQAYQQDPIKGRLVDSLQRTFDWHKVRDGHIARAKEFGRVLQPRQLWESLLSLKEQVWRSAPMHGDLHGENVRVRNGDAIIIDLANVGTGPLAADIANLEVWLSFELPPTQKQTPGREVWTTLVCGLFAPTEVRHPPYLSSTEVGVDWLRSCVRQTRMLGNSICECSTEYATAIAVHLLRRSCYQLEDEDLDRVEEDSYRRALAYYLGSNLVEWLSTAPVTPMRSA